MRKRNILHVPLLSPIWKKIALVFFPLPILLLVGLAFSNSSVDSLDGVQLMFGFWAIGFGILNLSEEKNEDEMIKSFRLQAYQTGFFWLIWGLAVLMIISYFGTGGFDSNFLTVFSVMFLLNMYVYSAFQYQKYMSNKD